jgi:hypothetical protein
VSQSKIHIDISWSDPLDNGGTNLDSYVIEMNEGTSGDTNVYRVVQIQPNAATDSFYTQTYLDNLGVYTNLVTGDIYTFKISSRNIVGDSTSKASISLMAATVPTAPSTPTRKLSSETSITI